MRNHQHTTSTIIKVNESAIVRNNGRCDAASQITQLCRPRVRDHRSIEQYHYGRSPIKRQNVCDTPSKMIVMIHTQYTGEPRLL